MTDRDTHSTDEPHADGAAAPTSDPTAASADADLGDGPTGASSDATPSSDASPAHGRDDPNGDADAEDGGLSDGVAFAASAVAAIALGVGSVLFVGERAVVTEGLMRVRPTVEGGGVGAGWVAGVTNEALGFLIKAVHAADAVMGVFILVMVFVHWAAFHRLADRMQPPEGSRTGATGDDGGGDRR
ncbi:hypothetical protein [Halegenticoccus tardaugens]|uniref:hypothetical protein n=1 Tax=Halegenticoccus tardaugens TaxID=2071624 RepID=UPI00100AE260|nr:hypothetical protein [Halegenticoccus tardaugens]